ncbi:MAG: stage III sporulation protein AF [Oscillospiraceae bacterium]|nr:stage III sporulation protein AF [Oscillospiraceae bacterium]
MEFIRVWTMQVAGAVIFGILCEMLAPEGKFKGIVRIVLGLILVIAVINPFVGISGRDLLLGELAFFDNAIFGEQTEVIETRGTLIRAYKRRLSEEINTRLASVSADFNIEVSPEINITEDVNDANFGTIAAITVVLAPRTAQPANYQRIEADITRILTEDFGLLTENIRFWRLGYGDV